MRLDLVKQSRTSLMFLHCVSWCPSALYCVNVSLGSFPKSHTSCNHTVFLSISPLFKLTDQRQTNLEDNLDN